MENRSISELNTVTCAPHAVNNKLGTKRLFALRQADAKGMVLAGANKASKRCAGRAGPLH